VPTVSRIRDDQGHGSLGSAATDPRIRCVYRPRPSVSHSMVGGQSPPIGEVVPGTASPGIAVTGTAVTGTVAPDIADK
jgi:hypothetical protein